MIQAFPQKSVFFCLEMTKQSQRGQIPPYVSLLWGVRSPKKQGNEKYVIGTCRPVTKRTSASKIILCLKRRS